MDVSLLPPLPEKFGRYQVQGVVGEGSMGRVYRAFDPLAQRVVAIKTLKSEYLATDSRDESLVRFRREAQAAGALSHPHIITVFDVGEDFFVMELLEGASLQSLLRERKVMDLGEALKLLGPVADALDYAHSKRTIHRDIKPGNIMVLPDGRPKIMDFGVAHLASTVMTAAGQFLGSPSYMAPEQIMRSEASPATDLFSFAVVTYEMLTGRKPFEGESITTIIYKVVNEVPPPPRQWNVDLPPLYDALFARALDKEASRRYPSASAFVAALEMKEIEVVLGPAPSPTTAPSPESPALDVPMPTVDLRAEEVARTLPAIPDSVRLAARPRDRNYRTHALAGVLAFLALLVAIVRDPGGSGPVAPPSLPSLSVDSEPQGATVSLDLRDVGRSPLVLPRVAPGLHTVRVVREGFAPAQLSFQIAAGVNVAPLRFVLQSTSASLALRSEPAGAGVSLDGRPAGTTPVAGLVLPAGPHELRVEQRGFKVWKRRVEAHVGETLELTARLERGEAKLGPEGAAVHWVREGDLLELTPDVEPPKRIAGDAAPYPEAARRLQLEGVVTVEMIVTETGSVEDARVVESAGEILDHAVLEAIRSWRFEPARKNGVKVRVRWTYRERFQSKS